MISLLENSVYHTLIISLICLLLIWYIKYHWNRRRLYLMAAKIKGPLPLPFIGNALSFRGSGIDIFNKFLRLTKEYKSPVRLWFGQQLFFLVWKPNDMEILMNSPYAVAKSDVYKYTKEVSGNGLFSATVLAWKRYSKLILPTINQRNLNEYVKVFSKNSEIMVENLRTEIGKGMFDISKYIRSNSVNIMCETTMGFKLDARDLECDYLHWVEKWFQIISTRIFSIFYRYDFIFNQTSMAKEQEIAVTKINTFTSKMINQKRKEYQKTVKENRSEPQLGNEPSKSKHFLEVLIKMSEDDGNITDEELLSQVNNVLIGGSLAPSMLEVCLLIMLGMFPEIQDKVYQEVMDVVGPDRAVEHTDLGKLKYLDMVVKETLRIFPVGQIAFRNITKDIKLDSCTLPAGSSVLICLTAAHIDPEIWQNPLKFDPNRFLPEEVAKRHPYSYVPFLLGLRRCLAPKFGMMVVKVVIATIIRKYRLSSDYKSVEDTKLKLETMVNLVDGFRVSIQLRN